MPVEKKAREFVEQLWRKVSHKYSKASKSKVDAVFKDVVSNLPDGKLKNELQSNFDGYTALLLKLKYANDAEPQATAGPARLPFNLLAPGEPCLDNQALLDMTDAEKLQMASLLASKAFHRLSGTNQVFDLLASESMFGNGKHSLPDGKVQETSVSGHVLMLPRLLALLPLTNDTASVQRIIGSFLKHLQPTVDVLLSSNDQDSLDRLLQALRSFFILMEVKNVRQAATKVSQYDDLMAAMLSCYVDISVASMAARGRWGKENGLLNEDTYGRSAGAHIASTVQFMLRGRPAVVGLDVLLQLTAVESSVQTAAANALLPLYRKLISAFATTAGPSPEAANDCNCYVKYIVAVKMASSLDSVEAADLVQDAYKRPAPATFIKWLQNADRTLLDEMPTEKKFAGIRVTQFLIEDAGMDFLERALQLTYRDEIVDSELFAGPAMHQPVPTASASVPALAGAKQDELPDGDLLFFIDTKCNEAVRRELLHLALGEAAPREEDSAERAAVDDCRDTAANVSSLRQEIDMLEQEVASDDDTGLLPLHVDAMHFKPEDAEAALAPVPLTLSQVDDDGITGIVDEASEAANETGAATEQVAGAVEDSSVPLMAAGSVTPEMRAKTLSTVLTTGTHRLSARRSTKRTRSRYPQSEDEPSADTRFESIADAAPGGAASEELTVPADHIIVPVEASSPLAGVRGRRQKRLLPAPISAAVPAERVLSALSGAVLERAHEMHIDAIAGPAISNKKKGENTDSKCGLSDVVAPELPVDASLPVGGRNGSPLMMRSRSASESSNCSYTLRSQTKAAPPKRVKPSPPKKSRRLSFAGSVSSSEDDSQAQPRRKSMTMLRRASRKGSKRAASEATGMLSPLAEAERCDTGDVEESSVTSSTMMQAGGEFPSEAALLQSNGKQQLSSVCGESAADESVSSDDLSLSVLQFSTRKAKGLRVAAGVASSFDADDDLSLSLLQSSTSKAKGVRVAAGVVSSVDTDDNLSLSALRALRKTRTAGTTEVASSTGNVAASAANLASPSKLETQLKSTDRHSDDESPLGLKVQAHLEPDTSVTSHHPAEETAHSTHPIRYSLRCRTAPSVAPQQ